MMNRDALEPTLLQALPLLPRKVRARNAAKLAKRLRALVGPVEEMDPEALVRLVRDALLRIDTEVRACDDEVRELTERHGAAADDAERRAVLWAHIEETVPDRRQRREDRKALDRWLGLEALRERIDRRRQAVLIEEELLLLAMPEMLRVGGVDDSVGIRGLATVLLHRAGTAAREPNQIAAVVALGKVAALHPGVREVVPDAPALLVDLVDRDDASPLLQARALEALLRTDPLVGLANLRRRLRPPYPGGKDFLFRRMALELCTPLLEEGVRAELLSAVAATDPSEFVRMAVCDLLAPHAQALPLLRSLAGRSGDKVPPKVRASAVGALARCIEAGVEGSWVLLREIIAEDSDPLVVRRAAERVRALVAANVEVPPGIAEALRTTARAPGTSGAVIEALAQAEHTVRVAGDRPRREWAREIARAVATLRPGERTSVPLDSGTLPPVPEDPTWLGTVLAELSRDDFGIYAELRGDRLQLWRGDRMRRRAWRFIHEVRNPAPNKRQAHRHTLARSIPGQLRAHPAHLDEITPTMVPGERVHVASEGGWSRHVPTVDDLVSLPVGSSKPVLLFSDHGQTVLEPPTSVTRRIANRLKLTFGYRHYADLRLASLRGLEPHERRRFVEALRSDLGVTVRFEPWVPEAPPPARIGELFAADGRGGLVALGAAGTGWMNQLADRFTANPEYLWSPHGNGVGALGLFTTGLFTWFLVNGYRRRQLVRTARSQIPLCIGGWGTRGKSGTERLKAALFTGLGYDVFAKTTGSEAMFVRAAPGAAQSEFFIYRPYDKATIWEQHEITRLAARLGVEVFLWECMALQPAFVELLQHEWMQDDLSTLTNAYPDHEDIQGPTGADVAHAITRFIPERGTLVTSEDHFLPLFREVAKERETDLVHASAFDAELIPDELLDLYPYREHPRNMALVVKLAEQLGIPHTEALWLMSENVQPEIGVLKSFAPARVRGRVLTFINGHSANERTGFMNNWVRSGLDAVDPEKAPGRAVITVINNRWDRVARSEVFARIMVEDASADRHVLIGTNLEGLQKYVRAALDHRLEQLEVVTRADLQKGPAGLEEAKTRLARQLAFLKVPRPLATHFLSRVAQSAAAAGYELTPTDTLRTAVEAALKNASSVKVEEVRKQLGRSVGPLLEKCVVARPVEPSPEAPELLASATLDEVRTHALYLLARMAVHARLQAALETLGEGGGESEIAAFHETFRDAYRTLFLEQLVVVQDPAATGDQIIDACARSVAPGAEVSILGAQNIKGTGLGWVYRWIYYDRVSGLLQTLRTGNPAARERALRALEDQEEEGLLDAGLVAKMIPQLLPNENLTVQRLQRLAERAARIHALRIKGLTHVSAQTPLQRAGKQLERTLDYLDSVRRRKISEQLIEDLIAGRISHARAAIETRKLHERQKGGWLFKKAPPKVETPEVQLALPVATEIQAPLSPERKPESVEAGPERERAHSK